MEVEMRDEGSWEIHLVVWIVVVVVVVIGMNEMVITLRGWDGGDVTRRGGPKLV